MAAVKLFQDTSMAAVASYENNENDYLWNVILSRRKTDQMRNVVSANFNGNRV